MAYIQCSYAEFHVCITVPQPRGSVQPCGSVTLQGGSCMSIGLQ